MTEATPAANAIDGDQDTIWHTAWSGADVPPLPHQITVTFGGDTLTINGLTYLPRQDGALVRVHAMTP